MNSSAYGSVLLVLCAPLLIGNLGGKWSEYGYFCLFKYIGGPAVVFHSLSLCDEWGKNWLYGKTIAYAYLILIIVFKEEYVMLKWSLIRDVGMVIHITSNLTIAM